MIKIKKVLYTSLATVMIFGASSISSSLLAAQGDKVTKQEIVKEACWLVNNKKMTREAALLNILKKYKYQVKGEETFNLKCAKGGVKTPGFEIGSGNYLLKAVLGVGGALALREILDTNDNKPGSAAKDPTS